MVVSLASQLVMFVFLCETAGMIENPHDSVWPSALRTILTVRHILVECNHFAQERKDIFGRRDVVESFRFHPTLIEFYYKF